MSAGGCGTPGWLEERQGWVAGGLLLVFFLLAFGAAVHKSPTFDEVPHLAAGYSYMALGDYRMNPEHPPLAKLVAAAPLLAVRPVLHAEDSRWQKALEWPFGQAFLFDWNDPDRLLFWGRLPLALLATLFGLVILSAARHFYGTTAGLLALALYAFTPEFLAHGPLVTTDFAAAATIFCAVFSFCRALLFPSAARVALFAGAAALCLVGKFSGLTVVPMLLLLGGLYLACPPGTSLTVDATRGNAVVIGPRGERLGRLLALAGAAACAGFLAIWACYGFRYCMTPDPELSRLIPWEKFDPSRAATRLVLALRGLHLLPETYLYGILECLKSLEGRNAFLLGQSSTAGWWYYYPLTFALKSPMPLIALCVAALGRCRRALVPSTVLLLPVAVYLSISLLNHTNIGNRHILPIYPFLIIFASQIGQVLDAGLRRRAVIAVALLLLWLAVGTLRVYPDFLAYGNELAGGPAGLHRYLADSNLDWGQDLKGLANYRTEHPEGTLFVSYFGAADPRRYLRDVEYLPGFFPVREVTPVPFDAVPPGARVAISVTNLNGVNVREYPGAEAFLARLRQLEPEARIGYSIHVYRVP